MSQYEKNEQSNVDFVNQQKKWQKSIEDFDIESRKKIAQMQAEYEKKIRIKNVEVGKLIDIMNSQAKEFNEVVGQTEYDNDVEIQNLERKYDTKLQKERDDYAKLKGENGIMNKKFSTLTKEIEDYKLDMQNLKENAYKLNSVVGRLESIRADLKKEVIPLIYLKVQINPIDVQSRANHSGQGKESLRPEKEKPRTRKIQIRLGLSYQGIKAKD
jgi:hypothetical protein